MYEIRQRFRTANDLLALTADELQCLILENFKTRKDRDQTFNEILHAEGEAGELFRPGDGLQADRAAQAEVKDRLASAWEGLRSAGMVRPADGINGRNGFVVLTEAGKRADARVDLAKARTRSWLQPTMLHPNLRGPAYEAFASGKYDTAVFEAFKAVEVASRETAQKAGENYAANVVGVELVRKAFDPSGGPLREQALPAAEREAWSHLFAGGIGAFKNPQSHRYVNMGDPAQAIEELMFASRLLRAVLPW